MEISSPFYAYKETRLDLEPAVQGSTVIIPLPAYGSATTYNFKAKQKSSHIADVPFAEDEDSFRQKYLATASSIYHRKHHKSPRSFLWRILEDRKALSIRAVDVARQGPTDANITLRLIFPSAIKSGCIAFSDSSDHDNLSVFVVTDSKQLYTLSLRAEFFRKPASTADNALDWCKSYSPSGFSFKHPHRLVALGPDELLASVAEGGLIRLERTAPKDGSIWQEQHYNEGGLVNAIRSALPFHASNALSYGDNKVDTSAAISVAPLDFSLDNTSFAFTVCADHKIRVWNLKARKIAYMSDMLDQDLEPQAQSKRVIDPSQSHLIKVCGANDESAICASFSPLGSGQFKFWNVTPTNDGNLNFVDIFPENLLEPHAPSSEIWTLSDFAVVVDKTQINKFSLWVLWKNNVTYRLHTLEFHSGPVATVKHTWKHSWESMALETLREAIVPTINPGDSADGTDKWLNFILAPGRFTTATIEAGLAIYDRGLGGSKESSRKTGPLPDRMCTIVASITSLSLATDGNMDYEEFRFSTNDQWRRFHRLLHELDKQRGEAMSLIIDSQGEMPWVVLADGITAVRTCSDLEKIWHNQEDPPAGTRHVARPLIAAASFRDVLPDSFIHNCKGRLAEEIFQEPSLTYPMRMRAFYEKCNFSTQIVDEDVEQLEQGLGQEGLRHITSQVYGDMLSLMAVANGSDKRNPDLPLAEFGMKLVVKGVQEMVELHRNICLEQLIVLVLIEAEVNHSEGASRFDSAAVFHQLTIMIQRLELIDWLASTQICMDLRTKNERSNSITDSTTSIAKQHTTIVETVTVLEGVMRHLLGLDLKLDQVMPSVFTDMIVQICAPDSIYEVPPATTQCFLLVQRRPDLALEFSRFTSFDPFSKYIQGRANLTANDPLMASALFKKAAFGMAYPNKHAGHRSNGYLDDIERSLLNAGLPEYYAHIASLYEKEKMYSFVIDFARLSLQFIKPHATESRHLQIRTEMQSRLFNAAIQTARYDLAHSFVAIFGDAALQASSLRNLVVKMCESSQALQLMDLPFVGLQDKVDEILAQKCQNQVDVNVGVPYHKILYAWRIKHNDFRGAAAVSFERLQRLLQSGEGDKMMGDDELETPITKQYITLINALSCVDPKQAWILTDEAPRKGSGAGLGGKNNQSKRKVVTLDDVRREYQAELDRIAAIQNDQFAFASGDEIDVL